MKTYICIDLKSFYASVECVERGLNPLTTNLVVADVSRTEKTICLAVSPSLKKYGLSGRSRLYEVVQKVKNINYDRLKKNRYHRFISKSFDDNMLNDINIEVDFIAAKPRMKLYMDYSNKIYNIYLKYFSSDDILVYSIDEVFCDITNYLNYYKLSPNKLITKIIKEVYDTTGITATGGIGTNMFLAKVAMDVVAKHMPANDFGVRIAYLDEISYRKYLWEHTPITDIWRVGKGISDKLYKNKMYTMGDVARKSLENEELLYKLFGVNAELLIDHAWGYEPVSLKDAKEYRPDNTSMSQGQVLHEPYKFDNTRLIVKEMIDLLTQDLIKKRLVTNQVVLTIGYDIGNLDNKDINYNGEIVTDFYGRLMPKHAHGTINLDNYSSSYKIILDKTLKLFDNIVNKNLLIRRINIAFCNLKDSNETLKIELKKQLDLFSLDDNCNDTKEDELRDRKVEETIIKIKDKYGKNSILKAMNLKDGATAIDRNKQVGGHSE